MKFITSLLVVATFLAGCHPKNYQSSPSISTQQVNAPVSEAYSAPVLNPATYNTAFYPSVLEAAKGIATPFLLQQGYFKLKGLTVNDSNLMYNGNIYHVSQTYWNPAKDSTKAFHQYVIKAENYAKYDADNLQNIWPRSCPNALYDSATKTFNATIDCVGFGSRLLAAVGNGSAENNAYLNLISTLRKQHTSLFASKGYVSTAYAFATAFPTLPTESEKGWTYIAGTIDFAAIDEYNHTKNTKTGGYSGVRKGGFAKSLPGDVLAFGNGPGTKYNGHFMVIEQSPRLLDADKLKYYYPEASNGEIERVLGLYKLYSVPVIDDSGLDAHFDDSRKQTSGIGHGTVLIATSKTDDAPVGIIMKGKKKDTVINIRLVSEKKSTSMFALSVGRYK